MTQESSKKTWSAHADKADSDPTQSLGAYLQRERQKKQQTVLEVAQATRIPPETLKALEAGNRSLLPLSVFTKGFVKIYAGHLGLNQAEILERFSNEWGDVSSTPPEMLSVESMAESSPFLLSFRFYFLLFLLALLISLAYFFFQADDTLPPAALTTVAPTSQQGNDHVVVSQQEEREVKVIAAGPSHETPLVSPQSAGKIIMEADEVFSDLPADLQDTPLVASSQAQGLAAAPQVLADSEDDKQLATSAQVAPKSPASAAPKRPGAEEYQAAPSIFQSVNLHIRFLKRTRISIAQDDGQPERFIFAPGEESTWQAASHITLHVDTADAVELTLNGSPITVADSNDGPLAITLPIDLDR